MVPDLERVRENVGRAETEDLLDRATVYRNGMEPEALDLIDAELRARGVSEAQLAAHWEKRAGALFGSDGLAVKCGLPRCPRPAVARRWVWHWLWGVLPLFPRPLAYCEAHLLETWRGFGLPPMDPPPTAWPPLDQEGDGIQKREEGTRSTPSD